MVESFSPEGLARDLRLAGLRAGLIGSGGLRSGIAIVAGPAAADLSDSLADPIAQELISFALSDEYATAR